MDHADHPFRCYNDRTDLVPWIGMPEEWGPVKRMFCLVVLPLRTRVSGGGRTGRGIGLVV